MEQVAEVEQVGGLAMEAVREEVKQVMVAVVAIVAEVEQAGVRGMEAGQEEVTEAMVAELVAVELAEPVEVTESVEVTVHT